MSNLYPFMLFLFLGVFGYAQFNPTIQGEKNSVNDKVLIDEFNPTSSDYLLTSNSDFSIQNLPSNSTKEFDLNLDFDLNIYGSLFVPSVNATNEQFIESLKLEMQRGLNFCPGQF